jgi:hypothetical protein
MLIGRRPKFAPEDKAGLRKLVTSAMKIDWTAISQSIPNRKGDQWNRP